VTRTEDNVEEKYNIVDTLHDCPVHGKVQSITYSVNEERLAQFCFRCMVDFLKENVTEID